MEKQKDKEPSFSKTPEDKKQLNIQELKKKLEECEKQKDEYLTGWQRARADFLNYQKGELERMGELIKYASAGLILKLLPILDNFEVIEKKLPENSKNDVNIKGLLQIKVQIQDFLKTQGVEEIKAIGQKFDPNLHEVAEEIEPSFAKASEGKCVNSGIIVEEVQKGYKIHGRLLRPARVKISK